MTTPASLSTIGSEETFDEPTLAPRSPPHARGAVGPHSPAVVVRPAGATPAWRRALRAFLRQRIAVVGVVLLAGIVAMAVLAPVLYPGDPLDMAAAPFLWPGQDSAFPLGTDSLGRDVAAGIAHGARVSLLVGAVAGYFGGWVDDAAVRLVELFQTIPPFLLVIVLVAIWEPSIPTITAAIGIVSWPQVARLVRAEFRSLRQKDFVMAARGLGFGHGRIIFLEILPNALPPIIVSSSVMVATAILMESALSFLGMGDANRVSWGSMIGNGREVLRTAWFLTAVPGATIVVTVLSLNLVSDGLNEALNPRLDERR